MMASSRTFLFLQLFLPAHLANFAIWTDCIDDWHLSDLLIDHQSGMPGLRVHLDGKGIHENKAIRWNEQ